MGINMLLADTSKKESIRITNYIIQYSMEVMDIEAYVDIKDYPKEVLERMFKTKNPVVAYVRRVGFKIVSEDEIRDAVRKYDKESISAKAAL